MQAIFMLQRARQRFALGALLTVVAASLVVPVWGVTFAGVSPASKLRMVAAVVLAALLGLPLRLVGRVIERRLALVAGVVAAATLWLGDFATMKLTGGPGSVVPGDLWLACLVTYAGAVATATYVARGELDVSLSEPGKGIALPGPQSWEDPLAVVLEEPANIFRGIVAVPGKLTLSSQQLKYVQKGKEHAEPLLLLKDVTVATRSLHGKAFSVELSDGTSYTFVVFDRDKWIVHINARLTAAKSKQS